MIKKEEIVKVGRFTKPHGIKGEIGLITTYDLFGKSDDPYIVCEINGIFVPFFIEAYRYKTDTVILLKMEHVDTGEEAGKFTNREVYYPSDAIGEDAAARLAPGDLTGYSLAGEQQGMIGEITGVDDSTMNKLLRVDYKGRELLIPVADELIVLADHREKRLTLSIPDGLLDL